MASLNCNDNNDDDDDDNIKGEVDPVSAMETRR